MNNIIVLEPSSNLRALGRNALAGKWKIAITAVLIYQICVTLPALILDQLFGKTLAELYGNIYYDNSYGMASDIVEGISYGAQKISTMSGVYIFLVTGAFTLGLTIFFINLFRARQLDVAQVFSGFEQFFKALGLMFMVGLFTFLWTLLLIVPGIIAAIRYSQAFFILADDPNKGIMECINESKWLMNGNKAKYFCLQLSFIGWLLLTSFAIAIVSEFFFAFIGGSVMMVVIDWILGLAICWVTAYMTATDAAFYDILRGNLRANTKDDSKINTYTPGQF
ncbi:DUF975 family protein [Ihubacter massiliensis]|uniref:DUF975 family protein n=1 Tax=Hominibacterium faecale TaxID=2839743 RepID=A0A9J6QSX6_9FIRM|nr:MULTISPECIES: DUF975 family protein [Eubacteriales Family XIII. Incertae Sedis]MCC2865413.1 DUF975 family protein [Anaerovorax odorimutans]MCI7300650.1 DUF975 family protein [Clostridia bacterium]MDE8732954.1 DUF975 family protein [Eubacteriales bacterium DFI.9.88]MDY3012057.1 DUF975 family protein [Clostridiales Family XIII bacterium]MCO7120862.1 DUF975 family protein [Ihubacter massiliensis]